MDTNRQLSPHFNLREFRCKKDYKDCPYCGGAIRVKNIPVYEFEVFRLELLRWALHKAYEEEVEIIISSGDRCRERNKEVSSLNNPDESAHWWGCAIDIFARIKRDKTIIPAEVIYDGIEELWGKERLMLKRNHLHITLG